MLNELYVAEKSARRAGFKLVERHPSLKDAKRIPTLRVLLDEHGHVEDLRLLPRDSIPWTLRDGQHNSFPFLQPKSPLWESPSPELRDAVFDKETKDKTRALLALEEHASFDSSSYETWPGKTLIQRTKERLHIFSDLQGSKDSAMPDALERFLKACAPEFGGNPIVFMNELIVLLIKKVRTFSQDAWVEVAIGLLLGKPEKGNWVCNSGLLIDAAGAQRSITSDKTLTAVTRALRSSGGDTKTEGICALAGSSAPRHEGNFPQPNLPGLGQTFLFAKNKDVPANDRYGRFAADAFPVGVDTIIKLEAGLSALTAAERNGDTWKMIPSEKPKLRDLLIAYVDGYEVDKLVASLTEEWDDDDEETVLDAFISLTGQVAENLVGRATTDEHRATVRIFVLRKLDPANRKVVYSGTMSVVDFYESAQTWQAGELNLPTWFRLPVYSKNAKRVIQRKRAHIAPLGLVNFTKACFVRGGKEHQEVGGITSAEALRFFSTSDSRDPIIPQVLRRTLRHRAMLMRGAAHALRRGGLDQAKEFDRLEALRSVTMLGLILYKLNRKKELYMRDTAFALGKLLSAVDQIHVGYCIDVRGGDIPPSLLGNQLFGMAQSKPAAALSTLGKRWKPYHAWVTRAHQNMARYRRMAAGQEPYPIESKRDAVSDGKTILRALKCGRALADEILHIKENVGAEKCDDVFQAELLLGYMTGINGGNGETPKTQDNEKGAKL